MTDLDAYVRQVYRELTPWQRKILRAVTARGQIMVAGGQALAVEGLVQRRLVASAPQPNGMIMVWRIPDVVDHRMDDPIGKKLEGMT